MGFWGFGVEKGCVFLIIFVFFTASHEAVLSWSGAGAYAALAGAPKTIAVSVLLGVPR